MIFEEYDVNVPCFYFYFWNNMYIILAYDLFCHVSIHLSYCNDKDLLF